MSVTSSVSVENAMFVVIEDADAGPMEVFTVAPDGALWHIWQGGGKKDNWSNWSSLGKPNDHVSILKFNVVCNKGDYGPLEAFALGSDGALWHIWQGGGKKDNWSNWSSLGKPQ